jgi:putative endopeptidase
VSKDRKPGDDFYSYVNAKWMKNTMIPLTKSTFGVSEEIERTIEDQTSILLEECIKKVDLDSSNYMDSLQSMLGRLALSVHSADLQKEPLETTKTILRGIQSLQSKEEVAVILGEFLRYKIRGIFTIYGQYENKNRSEYTYTIGTGGLGLEPSFYIRKSLRRGVSFALYKKFVKRIGDLFDIPTLDCVIRLEKILAGVLYRVDRDTVEHKRTGSELQEQFQHIPFSYLFASMGVSNWQSRVFFVESLRWLHTINKLFHHLGLDHWRLLLSHHFLLFALPWLPPPASSLSFQFFRKELRGQQAKMSRKEQSVYVVQQFATVFFSRLYVERMVNTEIKPAVKSMIETILEVGEKRVASIDWLETTTRKKAQEKIKKMRFVVGYPDSFLDHPIPELSKTNLMLNLLLLGESQTKFEIQKLGEPISQQKDWDDAVFVVNAYYYTQANEMVIPVGILQDPFFDKDRSIAQNYGALGCVLCHEITHAFDKEGKEYDPEGFQKKWWTPRDNRNYNKQTKALIDLYSQQTIYGFPVSGKKTLSENIADIGGMGLALDALHQKLDSLQLTGDERKEAYREFFLAYAVSWRLKDRKKRRIQALITDKHSPPTLRVNLVVSQFQEWYDAFDIQPEDKLYIAPEKRIRIF